MLEDFNALSQAVETGDDVAVVKLVQKALKDDASPVEILEKGLVPGIQSLGKLFKEGQVYLPEILISTRAMNRGVEALKPHLAGIKLNKKGTVVIGTVEGDLHDIGKNLVRLMLESNGFDVVDVGVDASPDTFVKAVRDNRADILALSSLLTMTMVGISQVIKALKESELKPRVMIGGAPITREYADEIGAEGYAADCVSAVDEAARLMKLN